MKDDNLKCMIKIQIMKQYTTAQVHEMPAFHIDISLQIDTGMFGFRQ